MRKTICTELAKAAKHLDLTKGLDTAALDALTRPCCEANISALALTVRGVHPVRDHQRLQLEIAKRLIDRCGYDTVAVEDLSATVDALDVSLNSGRGDVSTEWEALWPALRTQEIYELLRWIRLRNQSDHRPPLRLIGIKRHASTPSDRVDQEFSRSLLDCVARGAKIVYFAGVAHAARSQVRVTGIGEGVDHQPAGSSLSSALGSAYRAIAFTVGSVTGVSNVPPAGSSLQEAVLSAVSSRPYWLDFRSQSIPRRCRRWLELPAKLRCVGPRFDATHADSYAVHVPSLIEAFDGLVHFAVAEAAEYLKAPTALLVEKQESGAVSSHFC